MEERIKELEGRVEELETTVKLMVLALQQVTNLTETLTTAIQNGVEMDKLIMERLGVSK